MCKKAPEPVECIGVWSDFLCVKKRTKLRLVVLDEQPEEMKWPPLQGTIPGNVLIHDGIEAVV